MGYPKIPLAQQLIQLCKAKDILHVVISPGSRNAPLTIGFSNHPKIKTYSIVDERCAAFFALGIAQQLQKPVAIVCTSGSALLNYYPAIAEAYYSRVPLVVISADRPKYLIDVGDGQTIRQEKVFDNHILFSANLKELEGIEDKTVSENQYLINTAINTAVEKNGPVHINVPFAEPLYETQDSFSEEISVISPVEISNILDEKEFNTFSKIWSTAKKRMILIGVNPPNKIEQEFLDNLGTDSATVVFTESTSNTHHSNFFPGIDKIITPLTTSDFKDLQPDVLLTIGGLVVSKKIKAFLRTYQPKAHYHVGQNDAFNTFFCLTHHFKISENVFFNSFLNSISSIESNYQKKWLLVKDYRAIRHKNYFKNLPFSDFVAFKNIIEKLPSNIVMHLSNSSTIRYIQLFDNDKHIAQYCNRGTSGIDGSTSTAIGHAIVSEKQNLLITGDLSFFYDSNALWNNYIPKSFRIILINNSGGGIFRILPGDKESSNFETYFETPHNLSAEHLCKMYGFEYYSVSNETSLENQLESFFQLSDAPKLLEVFTPRKLNDTLLIDYFKFISD